MEANAAHMSVSLSVMSLLPWVSAATMPLFSSNHQADVTPLVPSYSKFFSIASLTCAAVRVIDQKRNPVNTPMNGACDSMATVPVVDVCSVLMPRVNGVAVGL